MLQPGRPQLRKALRNRRKDVVTDHPDAMDVAMEDHHTEAAEADGVPISSSQQREQAMLRSRNRTISTYFLSPLLIYS